MSLFVGLQGIKQLGNKLDRVIDKLRSDSIVARAAHIVERQAKKNATGRPGPRVRSGRLRGSITTEILSWDKARVGTNVYYAPFVEFGHAQTMAWGHLMAPPGWVPAYPFLYPAVTQIKTIGEWKDLFVTYSNEIQTEFGK